MRKHIYKLDLPTLSIQPNSESRIFSLETIQSLRKLSKRKQENCHVMWNTNKYTCMHTYTLNQQQLTCPPVSFETGWTAKDITGSGTFIEVMVYLTDPSVNVSPVNKRKHKLRKIQKGKTKETSGFKASNPTISSLRY